MRLLLLSRKMCLRRVLVKEALRWLMEEKERHLNFVEDEIEIGWEGLGQVEQPVEPPSGISYSS